MMPKVWLAVVLGMILGVGIAYSTLSPLASPTNMQPAIHPFENLVMTGQSTRSAQPGAGQPNWQLALVSLLVGIIVATPVFLLAKRPR